MNLNQDVEDVFAKLKTELCKLFGDTAGLHNVVDDAKTEIHALHGKMDSDETPLTKDSTKPLPTVTQATAVPSESTNIDSGTETPPTS